MKIIAEVPGYNRKFIVEAEDSELARLIGYYSANEREAADRLRIGNVIRVHEMYNQLYRLKDAQRELKTASQTLHSIANLVLMADPLIQAVVEEKKEGEGA